MIQNDAIEADIVQFEAEFRQKNDGDCLLEIVKKYGVKQAAIIEFVKTLYADDKNRIIIFSLFGATLNAIKSRLSTVGVGAVLCRGSVHSRKKAMKSFLCADYKGTDRVILLSVDNAASGADLNKATHVILVDPVPGTCSESYAAERQAVGRAVRQGMKGREATKVIRFVVRDTIEHETHERNQDMRRKLMENASDDNLDSIEYLTMKRTQSEIDFYRNINSNLCKVNDDEVVHVDENDGNVSNCNIDIKSTQALNKRKVCELYNDDDAYDYEKPPPKKQKQK